MASESPVVALTGATGYVGRFIAAELHRLGFRLRALNRPESDRGGFSLPIDWLPGDLRDEAALDRLVTGATAVVHLAYEHVPGRYRGGEGTDLPAWLTSNLYGSLALIQAAQTANVQHFVFLSSRAVFSRTLPGRVLDENHPTSPDSQYGAYKVAVEAFLNSAAASGSMRTYSLRATGVYGATWPIARSKWWPIIQAVLHEQDVSAFSGGGTEVYGGDVARVIGHLLTDSSDLSVPGLDLVHLSDLYVTQREIVRLARQISGQPGDLPPAPAVPPANPLVCRRLAELGITLGGQPLLESVVADLIQAAFRETGSPG